LLDDYHKADNHLAERFEKAEHGAAQLAGEPTYEEMHARRIHGSLWLGWAGELSRASNTLESSRPALVTQEMV
jgi:hypothetical protein